MRATRFGLAAGCLVILPFCFALALETAGPSIDHYQKRYGLMNVYDKLVDNHGDGFEALYGVRNFRTVLNGVVYRGGANNVYNKNGARPNMNPLPDEGLQHLCQEGFENAVYLYDTGFETATKLSRCRTLFATNGQLDYQSLQVLSVPEDAIAVLRLVHRRLSSTSDTSPIYLHCWNGWHASGYISALILRQFCGLSGKEAVAYWDRNTDGINQDAIYERVREKIRAFQPLDELKISSKLKAKLCP